MPAGRFLTPLVKYKPGTSLRNPVNQQKLIQHVEGLLNAEVRVGDGASGVYVSQNGSAVIHIDIKRIKELLDK